MQNIKGLNLWTDGCARAGINSRSKIEISPDSVLRWLKPECLPLRYADLVGDHEG